MAETTLLTSRNWGLENSWTLKVYESQGGYKQAKSVLKRKSMQPKPGRVWISTRKEV